MKSFTLIEIIVVMAIISLLALLVYVAVNPAKQIAQSLDARRSLDISNIIDAIHQYTIDNKGNLPAGLSSDGIERQIGSGTSGCRISTGNCIVIDNADCVDLATSLVDGYMAEIPIDPKGGTAAQTLYSVVINTKGLITVKACNAANPPISISK